MRNWEGLTANSLTLKQGPALGDSEILAGSRRPLELRTAATVRL